MAVIIAQVIVINFVLLLFIFLVIFCIVVRKKGFPNIYRWWLRPFYQLG